MGVAPEDLDGVSPLESVLKVTIVRDMDPDLVDAEYTTDSPDEADEFPEMANARRPRGGYLSSGRSNVPVGEAARRDRYPGPAG